MSPSEITLKFKSRVSKTRRLALLERLRGWKSIAALTQLFPMDSDPTLSLIWMVRATPTSCPARLSSRIERLAEIDYAELPPQKVATRRPRK